MYHSTISTRVSNLEFFPPVYCIILVDVDVKAVKSTFFTHFTTELILFKIDMVDRPESAEAEDEEFLVVGLFPDQKGSRRLF